MRSKLALAAVTFACTALTATASETTDDVNSTGLTFYSGQFTTPVLHVPNPDGTCLPFPPEADSVVGWSNVEHVVAFWTDDCSGQPIGVGTLRTFTPGEYASFIAY